jgi:hypothetical protein
MRAALAEQSRQRDAPGEIARQHEVDPEVARVREDPAREPESLERVGHEDRDRSQRLVAAHLADGPLQRGHAINHSRRTFAVRMSCDLPPCRARAGRTE